MSRRAAAALAGLLLLFGGGCANKRLTEFEPACMQKVKDPLVDISDIKQLGIVTIARETLEVSANGDLESYAINSDGRAWVVRTLDESAVLIIRAGSKQTPFPYSVLTNDGERDLYLSKGVCTSSFPVAEAVAYKNEVTLTVYATP